MNRWLFLFTAVAIGISLLLGGGTRSGFLSDAVLQLVCLPLFLLALYRPGGLLKYKAEIAICAAIALVPLLQLVPLPRDAWLMLPHRAEFFGVIASAGVETPALPISVGPEATWLALLSLLPPIAIFLATLQLTFEQRRKLTLVWLSIGMASVFLGLVQVAQGESSPLRFFEVTNLTEAVGFFANRNHFAALLYCLTPMACAWATEAAVVVGDKPLRQRLETSAILPMVAGFTALVVLVAAQAMARSRAGLGLAILALLGSFAIAFAGRSDTRGFSPGKLMAAAISVGVLFAVQFALYRVMERFTTDPLEDARIPFSRNTIEAALSYMPFGSGMGTFVPVYSTFEKPADTLANTYANHAHNDFLELWLEAGVVGALVLALFAGWFAVRAFAAWRPKSGGRLDQSLMQAATIVVALLIAHSLVDYPLRTAALMALFAFSCALLTEPPVAVGEAAKSARGAEEARSARTTRPRTRRMEPQVLAGSVVPRAPDVPAAPRKDERQWPEAWRRPPGDGKK